MVRIAFAIDTHDREIMAWVATPDGGISGEMIRGRMLNYAESRFDALRAPHSVQCWLTIAPATPPVKPSISPQPSTSSPASPQSSAISATVGQISACVDKVPAGVQVCVRHGSISMPSKIVIVAHVECSR